MANSNTATLQREVMNNVEDLQFFLRDMNQWEAQIKKKDLELRQQTSQAKAVFGIRNASKEASTEEKVKEFKPEKVKKKSVRFASSDGNAEDKFDMKRSCEDVDEDSSSSEDEELELDRRRQHALLEKDKGNQLLNAGKINAALESYTKGCQLDPDNALLPANRALAFLKSQQFGAAEKDCDTALSLDPTYVKAYQRRAAAREALGNYEKAAEDLQMVLNYEPRNKDALNKLEKLKKLIENSGKNVLEVSPTIDVDLEGEILLPFDKPEHLRSRKPLQRIKVCELNDKQTVSKTSPKVPKLESVKPATGIYKPQPGLPKSPSSFFRLQADFAQLKSYPELRYQYFKNIPCNQLPTLFRENLEPNILSDVIELLGEYYIKNNDDVYEPLKRLALTKRFSTLKLFLSQKDKDVLQRLFKHMKSQECYNELDVSDLLEEYGLNDVSGSG